MSFKTIGELVELQRGTTYKSALLDQPGPFLLGLGSIGRNGGFRGDKLKTYGGDSPEKLLVYPNDLYVSLKDVTQSGDLLGAIAKVPEFVPCGRLTQDTVKLIFKNDFNKDYFYWSLRTPQYREYCRAHSTGTTNLGLSREDFFKFTLPELTDERLKLTSLLNGIEDKINISISINHTLETLAQTLFKSWFVDFEPVKAKIAALEAGGSQEEATLAAMAAISGKDSDALVVFEREHPEKYVELKATAELFPSAIKGSELGEIPEGWAIVKTEELVDKIGMGPFGSNIKVSTFVDEGVPIISGQHLKESILNDGDNNFVTLEHADKLKSSNVFRGDVIFTHAGSIGQVSIIPECSVYDRYVISQRQFFLRANNKLISPYFLLYFFRSKIGQHLLLSNASQVGVPSIARPSSHLKSIELVAPEIKLVKKFEEHCKTLINGVVQRKKQTMLLQNIRDTLLPKLLSGEITLPEAEQAVSEAENV